MSTASFSQKEYSENEIKQKLKVDEYVFEIEGKDIYHAYLTYCFDNIKTTTYKDGKKEDVSSGQSLRIELEGEDITGKIAWVSFDLNITLDYLNTLSKIPTDITKYLLYSEAFIKKPNEETSEFLDFEIPKNNENDIYKNFSSLWVSKIDENKFIFKLTVPNVLFTYFNINFIEETKERGKNE